MNNNQILYLSNISVEGKFLSVEREIISLLVTTHEGCCTELSLSGLRYSSLIGSQMEMAAACHRGHTQG